MVFTNHISSLTESDRQALKSAATTISTSTMIGTLLGLSLGAYAAFRVRSNRAKMFQTFRAHEKPVAIRFSNGREEMLPDLSPLLKPTTAGQVLTWALFLSGGLFVGGELGILGGVGLAKRSLNNFDPEARKRIETAFRSFRADVMRKQIQELESNNNKQLELTLS